MHVFAGVRATVLAAAVLAGSACTTAAAPVVVAALGSTLSADGQPGTGGASGSLGLMVPVEGRWAFGLKLFVDDLGTGLTDLTDPNTGEALGRVGDLHRWAYGGEWCAEATLHAGRRARLLWGAGFGYGRQESDRRGDVLDAVSAITASTSASFLVPASHGHAFGLTLAARRGFFSTNADPNRATNWTTAALEWRWQGTPKE